MFGLFKKSFEDARKRKEFAQTQQGKELIQILKKYNLDHNGILSYEQAVDAIFLYIQHQNDYATLIKLYEIVSLADDDVSQNFLKTFWEYIFSNDDLFITSFLENTKFYESYNLFDMAFEKFINIITAEDNIELLENFIINNSEYEHMVSEKIHKELLKKENFFEVENMMKFLKKSMKISLKKDIQEGNIVNIKKVLKDPVFINLRILGIDEQCYLFCEILSANQDMPISPNVLYEFLEFLFKNPLSLQCRPYDSPYMKRKFHQCYNHIIDSIKFNIQQSKNQNEKMSYKKIIFFILKECRTYTSEKDFNIFLNHLIAMLYVSQDWTSLNELIKIFDNGIPLGIEYRAYTQIFEKLIELTKTVEDYDQLLNLLNRYKPIVSTEKYEFFESKLITYANNNNDSHLLIKFLRLDWSHIDEKIKTIDTLINMNKLSELLPFITQLVSVYYSRNKIIVSYCNACIKDQKYDILSLLLKYIFIISVNYNDRVVIQKLVSTVPKEKIIEQLTESDKKDTINFLAILWLEVNTMLENYSDIDFEQFPEVSQCLTALKNKDEYDNYSRFHKTVKKIIKSGKPVLALYILNRYSTYRTKSDVKLWIDSYVDAFVALNKVDIIAKYYDQFDVSMVNIELLEHISEFHIQNKNLAKASAVIKKIEKIEPSYPYIEYAKNEISKINIIQELSEKDIDVEVLNSLSGKEFEDLLIEKFKELGFKVVDTPTTGDFGADIIVDTEDETRFIIQCKRFKNKVNLKAVQEVVSALQHYNGDIGIVITNSTFLSSAIKLAQSNDVELWDNLKLMKFLTGDISFSSMGE